MLAIEYFQNSRNDINITVAKPNRITLYLFWLINGRAYCPRLDQCSLGLGLFCAAIQLHHILSIWNRVVCEMCRYALYLCG